MARPRTLAPVRPSAAIEEAYRRRLDALLDEMHSSAEVQPVEPTDEVSAALLDVGACGSAGMLIRSHVLDFIAKPVDPESLFGTVLKWLERGRV